MLKIGLKVLVIGVLFSLYTNSTHASEAVKGAKKDLEVFKEEMIVKINDMEKQIQILKQKTQEKGSRVNEQALTELEENRLKVKKELAELKKASQSSWQKAKAAFADSVDKLNTKIQKAAKPEESKQDE